MVNLRQREALVDLGDFDFDFCEQGRVVLVGEGLVDPVSDLNHLSLFHAACRDGWRADTDTTTQGDLFGVERNAILIHGDTSVVECLAGDFAIEPLRTKIDKHEVIVRATTDDAVADLG